MKLIKLSPSARSTLKRFLPNKLFARALLILLLPVILLQLFVAYVFYDRHWNSVVRNMASASAGDFALVAKEYDTLEKKEGHAKALKEVQDLGDQLGIDVTFRNDPYIVVVNGGGRDRFPDLYDELAARIAHPLSIKSIRQDNVIRVRVGVEGGALDLMINRKFLASSTTYIFILWMMGSGVLLTTIAILFLRNQIRPIVQLARAAEQFGLGQEMVEFNPKGASEIRRAANAFILMADRIRRQVQSRTEMLAGISHDLRTPLTRMKLEVELGTIDEATRAALTADIEDMRRMIDEYLDFARGDAGEPAESVDIAFLVRDTVELYARRNQAVSLGECEPITLMVRPNALKRALQNIIENALRYGQVARVSLEQNVAFARIRVIDRGPGIPEADHETVFKPFTRLDPSRNMNTGGVGLGLSIARDIAQNHGGSILLENQKDAEGNVTGLAVTLRLPREVHALTQS